MNVNKIRILSNQFITMPNKFKMKAMAFTTVKILNKFKSQM